MPPIKNADDWGMVQMALVLLGDCLYSFMGEGAITTVFQYMGDLPLLYQAFS
jgi:hypothetical protein